MSAGKLRHRITIQGEGTRTSDGQGGYTQEWTNVAANVPAYLKQSSGRETNAADRLQAESTLDCVIRYRSDVTTAQRVSHGGAVYNIRSVEDVEFRARWLRLRLEGGVAT